MSMSLDAGRIEKYTVKDLHSLSLFQTLSLQLKTATSLFSEFHGDVNNKNFEIEENFK